MPPWDITPIPPKTENISITVTLAPPRPASSAADNPDIPAPTIVTGVLYGVYFYIIFRLKTKFYSLFRR